jgi:hypothetical protein
VAGVRHTYIFHVRLSKIGNAYLISFFFLGGSTYSSLVVHELFSYLFNILLYIFIAILMRRNYIIIPNDIDRRFKKTYLGLETSRVSSPCCCRCFDTSTLRGDLVLTWLMLLSLLWQLGATVVMAVLSSCGCGGCTVVVVAILLAYMVVRGWCAWVPHVGVRWGVHGWNGWVGHIDAVDSLGGVSCVNDSVGSTC